jgi:hypothetical protein
VIVKAENLSVRYRVVTVTWAPDDRTAFGDAREFKTLKRAMEYRDSLIGKETLIQTGVVRWMNDKDAYAEITRLQAEGAHIE